MHKAPSHGSTLGDQTPALDHEDSLLASLANVSFSSTGPATVPTPVTAVPGDVDPEHAGIRAALEAGTIPTFVDEPGMAPIAAPQPIDVAAEQAAYREFLAFINAHKDPNTTITVADPDLIVKAFS